MTEAINRIPSAFRKTIRFLFMGELWGLTTDASCRRRLVHWSVNGASEWPDRIERIGGAAVGSTDFVRRMYLHHKRDSTSLWLALRTSKALASFRDRYR